MKKPKLNMKELDEFLFNDTPANDRKLRRMEKEQGWKTPEELERKLKKKAKTIKVKK